MGKPRDSQIVLETLTREEAIEDILDNIDGRIQVFTTSNEALLCRTDHRSSTSKTLAASDVKSSELFHKWLSDWISIETDQSSACWSCEFSEAGISFALSATPPGPGASKHSPSHDIQAIGHFCPEESVEYKSGLLSIVLLAQKIFIDQPIRLFLKGLYLRGCLLELWTFDRSGIYCTQSLDISHDQSLLSSILHNFRVLEDSLHGQSDYIQQEGSIHFIRLNRNTKLPVDTLYLEDYPVAFSEDIVGNGTTCYGARVSGAEEFVYIVKFKWCSSQKGSEERLMRLAEERGAQGIAYLQYEEKLCDTSQFRNSSHRPLYRKFLASTPHSTNGSTSPSEHVAILGSTEETQRAFENRILTMTVMSPVGNPLQSARNPLELLRAIRDAVKAHRSLFQVAKILHQDISLGNIIIVPNPTDGQNSIGVLIDLDSAIDVSETGGEQGHIVGTRPYMAVGVLLGRRHTYRHDLESFLYLLLRAALVDANDNLPESSILRKWTQGTFHQSAMHKLSQMEEANFSNILAELPPRYQCFKPLAEKMRQVLFPIEDGSLWTGTDGSREATNALYDSIVGAFDEAIFLEARRIQ